MGEFLANYGNQLLSLSWEHLYISAAALVLGILVAVPLGIVLTRFGKFADIVIGLTSILQTIPSLALLALMVPFIGIGLLPAIVALFIYSLLPILRNTYVGMKSVNSSLIDAGKGMGMTDAQLIKKVELPQAAPVIMSGIRLSGTYVIAWAALASYIGAGGLGDMIFSGLNNYIPALIIGGTIPVTLLGLAMDWLLGILEKKLTPRNLKEAN